ncbi:PP2C family protein-serine/threonine phosphatase [Persicimonas caeni]|nr:protein phosphatase 2C domain-containing protein [Persicimonas caeni]
MNSIQLAGMSTTGRRETNQDAYFIDADMGLCVVCDGMGGYTGGEVASKTAVEVIRHFFAAKLSESDAMWPYPLRRELTLEENMVSVSVQLAHQAICARRRGEISRMGTTVVVAACADEDIVLGHVGDSRIYRLRDGELEQLTRDHSMYNELYDSGTCDLPPIEKFRYRHVLSRALGYSQEGPENPDIRRERMREGDTYLLCTDGLHDVLGASRIAYELGTRAPAEACATLIDMAYEAGSTDNITAAVVRVSR